MCHTPTEEDLRELKERARGRTKLHSALLHALMSLVFWQRRAVGDEVTYLPVRKLVACAQTRALPVNKPSIYSNLFSPCQRKTIEDVERTLTGTCPDLHRTVHGHRHESLLQPWTNLRLRNPQPVRRKDRSWLVQTSAAIFQTPPATSQPFYLAATESSLCCPSKDPWLARARCVSAGS